MGGGGWGWGCGWNKQDYLFLIHILGRLEMDILSIFFNFSANLSLHILTKSVFMTNTTVTI